MIIEKFDFRTFFETKNVTNSQRVREYGIGAVSVITPRQAITRMTDPDPIYRIPGLGYHDEKLKEIAKEILEIRKEKSKLPKGLLFQDLEKFTDLFLKTYLNEDYIAKRNEEYNAIESFLNSVVKIEYTSNINFDLVEIKIPSLNLNDSLVNNELKITKEMYEGVCDILTSLENIGLSTDVIKINGLCYHQNYEQIKKYLNELIDPNIIFPFEENIIAEQRSIKEKNEYERNETMKLDYEYINDLKKVIDSNKDKRICVVGTSCTGKTTYLSHVKNGLDMDKIIFPLMSEEEKEYVCQTTWTPEIGETMDKLVKERIKIIPGQPVFGTVIIDCDLIIYLDITDELLQERTKSRNVDYQDAKNMKDSIERDITDTTIPVIRILVKDRELER